MKISQFRKLIREEARKVLREALNKDIRQFADDIWKKLQAAGFQVEGAVDNSSGVRDAQDRISKDPNLVYMLARVTPTYETLEIYGNNKSKQKILGVCNKFQTSLYSGPEKQIDPKTIKQVVNAFNPGDIYTWPQTLPQGPNFKKSYARMAKPNTNVQTSKPQGGRGSDESK